MNIEKVMIDYLLEHNIDAYAERPKEKPSTYVLVEKTGGTEANLIETATIAFQSVAPSLAEASFLNDAVKEIVGTADTLDRVSAVSLNSDANFTNPTAKQYRYQSVYNITYRI